MSKFLKRYLICAVIILLIICILYYYFINGRDSDEFISVSYVSDDDEIISSKNNWNENELLNLTNFRYINQPTKVVCRPQNDELFGKPRNSRHSLHSILTNNIFFFSISSHITGYVLRKPRSSSISSSDSHQQ